MASDWVHDDLRMMRLAKQRATVLLDGDKPVTLISWKSSRGAPRARIMFADNTTREVAGSRITVREGRL
jgi:hypothetical protein